MKQKTLVPVILTASVLAIVGSFVFSKLSSKNSSVTQVEVVDPISTDFNQQALTALTDPSKAVDYTPQIPLTGLGNNKPFGPLQ